MIRTRNEFRNQLEETLHSHLTVSHPVFALLLDTANPQPEFLKQVALQGYQLTKNFLEYIENLFFYCPIPRHKRRLLHNMYEEETAHLEDQESRQAYAGFPPRAGNRRRNQGRRARTAGDPRVD